MITTSTPSLNFTEKKEKESGEIPELEFPSAKIISSILNYSKNLEIKKSSFITEIEVIKS